MPIRMSIHVSIHVPIRVPIHMCIHISTRMCRHMCCQVLIPLDPNNVDFAALYDALAANAIGGAILDVWPERTVIFFIFNFSAHAATPRTQSNREGGTRKISARRIFRHLQIDTGSRRSPSACSKIFRKKDARSDGCWGFKLDCGPPFGKSTQPYAGVFF